MTTLLSEQDSSPLELPVGVWVEALPQLTIPASSGNVQIVGYVEDLPDDGMLQLLINGVSVDTENGNTTNYYLGNAASPVLVDLQAMSAVGSGNATVTTRGLIVYTA